MVTLMFPTIVRNWTVFILFVLFASSLNSKFTVRSENKLPLIINTWAFVEANEAAWSVLHQSTENDAALDALVEGCTTCERLQCDGTVGYGGSPDENGETALDAMIIDGTTMNIGAVANLRQIKDAIKVARHVLENTLHTLLVGEAASDFAESMGFQREPLSTSNSRKIWHNWIKSNCQPNYWYNVQPDPKQSCGPYSPNFQTFRNQLGDREPYEFGRWNHDTIGMIVIDKNAKIFAGTSTNGARYKIPGRVGDSPIPGAGAYADNDVGAAVATGDGDVMMRFLPSLLAVEFLRIGKTPAQAAHDAMQRIVRFYPNFSGGLVVVDKFGNYSADCVGMKSFPYSLAFGDAMQKSEVKHVQCTIKNFFKKRVELK